MDKTAVIGIALSLAALAGGQYIEGGQLSALVQPAAFMIVVCGTIGALLLQTPWPILRQGIVLCKWLAVPPQPDKKKLRDQLIYWSQLSRKEGLLALENQLPLVKDTFLKKGLEHLIDGADPDRLRSMLEIEIEGYEADLLSAANIWESAGGYSPTLGILGAVLGLIHVMENLSEPTKLGSGIAVAFVATVYGVGLANLIYLPVAGKLRHHIANLVKTKEMQLDGLIGIALGDNPRLIDGRLKSYL